MRRDLETKGSSALKSIGQEDFKFPSLQGRGKFFSISLEMCLVFSHGTAAVLEEQSIYNLKTWASVPILPFTSRRLGKLCDLPEPQFPYL